MSFKFIYDANLNASIRDNESATMFSFPGKYSIDVEYCEM